MSEFQYSTSQKYTDLDTIYAQCSGPGGLQLAEFMANKMDIQPGRRLLDVGCNRGYQTCFLAKEYAVQAVGLDPWLDRMNGEPMIEHLRRNAEQWGVANAVMGLMGGVPDSNFASNSFDYVYSTTALEMVRVSQGVDGYLKCLAEIHRVLRPGGVFGLGEPMHLDVPLPPDLEPYVSQPEYAWKDCFRSLTETVTEVENAGFEIIDAAYASEARKWWLDFAKHDPFCQKEPEDDPKVIAVDNGRWVSFGYIIARKPK